MVAEKIKELTISVIPGTGNIGNGLARHLSIARVNVILASRDASKAKAAAAKLSESIKRPVKGLSFEEAAAAADVVFWAPAGYLADRETMLKSLAKHLEGKSIIDCRNAFYFFDEKVLPKCIEYCSKDLEAEVHAHCRVQN